MFEQFDPYNAAYIQQLYEDYVRNPGSVDPSWQSYFAELAGTAAPPSTDGAAPAGQGPTSARQLRAARALGELVDAIRLHCHRAAQLDPLGAERTGHPMLSPDFHGASIEEIESVPAELVQLESRGRTTKEALDWLRATYMGSIGYEFEHLEHPERREWLREQIESGVHTRPIGAEDQK